MSRHPISLVFMALLLAPGVGWALEFGPGTYVEPPIPYRAAGQDGQCYLVATPSASTGEGRHGPLIQVFREEAAGDHLIAQFNTYHKRGNPLLLGCSGGRVWLALVGPLWYPGADPNNKDTAFELYSQDGLLRRVSTLEIAASDEDVSRRLYEVWTGGDVVLPRRDVRQATTYRYSVLTSYQFVQEESGGDGGQRVVFQVRTTDGNTYRYDMANGDSLYEPLVGRDGSRLAVDSAKPMPGADNTCYARRVSGDGGYKGTEVFRTDDPLDRIVGRFDWWVEEGGFDCSGRLYWVVRQGPVTTFPGNKAEFSHTVLELYDRDRLLRRVSARDIAEKPDNVQLHRHQNALGVNEYTYSVLDHYELVREPVEDGTGFRSVLNVWAWDGRLIRFDMATGKFLSNPAR